ncbi:glucan endo-1,3-beta-glucosidase-like [Panicum miliaceum]|uniref:Glucan endo-1,3-beta-glucosidase-like n=1 Tax=Panicum miliaceum TaxID=4540 RepID=A0A3L6PCM5_PANMI|nr:glucan endo-1,3-beta-glucosidase-like [Panicum miliaceum]
MLKFRKEIGSPLMVNLNYAIFHPNAVIYMPVTKLKYISMFDVQMDAVYTAMRKCSAMAEPSQVGVGLDEARDFNAGIIRIWLGWTPWGTGADLSTTWTGGRIGRGRG